MTRAREIFEKYATALAYIEVETPSGDRSLGSAFHVGEGVYVTARHVIEGNTIVSLGGTEHTYVRLEGAAAAESRSFVSYGGEQFPAHRVESQSFTIKEGPVFHSRKNVDVAVFRVNEVDEYRAAIPLGDHLDDWIGESDFVMSEVLALGYPPVPLSRRLSLMAARGEVLGHVDLMGFEHVHFLISALPRGGFSGGVAILGQGQALGMITQSLMLNGAPAELGYMAVVGVEPIYQALGEARMLPTRQADAWDDFWSASNIQFNRPPTRGEAVFDRERRGGPGVWFEMVDDGRKLSLAVKSMDGAVLDSVFAQAMAALSDHEPRELPTNDGRLVLVRPATGEARATFEAALRDIFAALVEQGFKPEVHHPEIAAFLPRDLGESIEK